MMWCIPSLIIILYLPMMQTFINQSDDNLLIKNIELNLTNYGAL